MVRLGRFCIDRYEAPNREGATPLLMQSALDGQAWCAERAKRLCLESEWVRACAGPNGWNYPYGPAYRGSVCNDDKTWQAPQWRALRSWPSEAASAEVRRLDQSEPAGARADCRSAEGVFDLTGNAAEWVVRTEDNPTDHDHVVKGCYWSRCFRPPHTPACDYVNYAHVGAERSYEMGFRCCRDADLAR
jgi:formylglycine-generating enzyme required for sulfatase activity